MAKRLGERALGANLGLFVTIWLWSVYSSFDPLVAYIIPGLHSIQYIYFVWLLQRNRTRSEANAVPEIGIDVNGRVAVRLTSLALGALVIGWVAFRGGPELLDGTLVLSDPELRGGLGATTVLGGDRNVHQHSPLLHGQRDLAARERRVAGPDGRGLSRRAPSVNCARTAPPIDRLTDRPTDRIGPSTDRLD